MHCIEKYSEINYLGAELRGIELIAIKLFHYLNYSIYFSVI